MELLRTINHWLHIVDENSLAPHMGRRRSTRLQQPTPSDEVSSPVPTAAAPSSAPARRSSSSGTKAVVPRRSTQRGNGVALPPAPEFDEASGSPAPAASDATATATARRRASKRPISEASLAAAPPHKKRAAGKPRAAASSSSSPSSAAVSSPRSASSRSPRVSFGGCTTWIVHKNGRCMPCAEGESELKESDLGRYYPASAAQQKKGLELAKRWPKEKPDEIDQGFCQCADGCRANCPCHANGIGCWWEGGGCNCSLRCKSPTPGHVLDQRAVFQARQTAIRQANLGYDDKRRASKSRA